MRCPTCPDTALLMTDRQGVEIDYCPQCRGVWLDRGEIDKLIERAATAAPAPNRVSAARAQPEVEDSDYRDARGHQPRRKTSWLSDLFD